MPVPRDSTSSFLAGRRIPASELPSSRLPVRPGPVAAVGGMVGTGGQRQATSLLSGAVPDVRPCAITDATAQDTRKSMRWVRFDTLMASGVRTLGKVQRSSACLPHLARSGAESLLGAPRSSPEPGDQCRNAGFAQAPAPNPFSPGSPMIDLPQIRRRQFGIRARPATLHQPEGMPWKPKAGVLPHTRSRSRGSSRHRRGMSGGAGRNLNYLRDGSVPSLGMCPRLRWTSGPAERSR